MKPPAPEGGGWRAVFLFGSLAMSGVPRLRLLADGRRPVMQMEAAELVVSFLPLRVPRAFDLMVPMYGLGDRPLEDYCAFLHAYVYGTDGRLVDDANEGDDDDFIQECGRRRGADGARGDAIDLRTACRKCCASVACGATCPDGPASVAVPY